MEGQENQNTKPSASKSIKDAVAQKIADAGPTVLESVAETLASTELARRKDIVIAAYGTLNGKRNEFNKMKPDAPKVITITDGKEVTSESWTEAGLKKYKETQQKIEKLSNALDKALESNTTEDYNKLVEASK